MDWGLINQATQILGNGPSVDYSSPDVQQLGNGPKGFATGAETSYSGSTRAEPYDINKVDPQVRENSFFNRSDWRNASEEYQNEAAGQQTPPAQTLGNGPSFEEQPPTPMSSASTSSVNQALEASGSDYRVPNAAKDAMDAANGVGSQRNGHNLTNSGIMKLGKKVVGAVAAFYTGGASAAAMNVAGNQISEAGGSGSKVAGVANMAGML